MRTSIINMPKLDPQMTEYANSYLSNALEFDARQPFTAYAEFIEWLDNPDCWAGAWAEKFVLCVVNDYTSTNLKSRYEVREHHKTYAKYSIYNVPHKFRSLINEIVYYDGQECTKSLMSDQEYAAIHFAMSKVERDAWQLAQDKQFAMLEEEAVAYPTITDPIRIHLVGTDDCSYSLCVHSHKAAFEILENLKSNPTWVNLKKIGFVFTN